MLALSPLRLNLPGRNEMTNVESSRSSKTSEPSESSGRSNAVGVYPKIVSEMLGHSSIAITLDTYSHVIPGMQEVAASAMEDALGD
jgi:hypothetical protein